MVKIMFFVALLQFAECDLIGYNRLGNNVHSHFHLHVEKLTTVEIQVLRQLIANPAMSTQMKSKLLENLHPRKMNNNGTKRNRRYRKYMNKRLLH